MIDTRIAEQAPLMEINTTPLIDVLLVLLIMFIVTIPVQSHAVKIDLPGNRPVPDEPIERLRNTIVVTRGDALLWNGAAVDRAELGRLMARVAAMPEAPEVHLRPDAEARYEPVDEVLAMARRNHVRALGFVGNEAYSRF